MYRKILVALENASADHTLLPHVAELAGKLHSHILLLHVADGWAARNYERLKLVESQEMREDRAYLEKVAQELRKEGLKVAVQLALGDPAAQIVKTAESEHCDLIAMGSHGHRLIGDFIHGSAIHEVRHRTSIPVLLVRDRRKRKISKT
ncbi:MAG TPA: universal stress protein [Verrucomicrobiae bacterium]|nr:universal stress protein [Verrucomicrobiae bacterium]